MQRSGFRIGLICAGLCLLAVLGLVPREDLEGLAVQGQQIVNRLVDSSSGGTENCLSAAARQMAPAKGARLVLTDLKAEPDTAVAFAKALGDALPDVTVTTLPCATLTEAEAGDLARKLQAGMLLWRAEAEGSLLATYASGPQPADHPITEFALPLELGRDAGIVAAALFAPLLGMQMPADLPLGTGWQSGNLAGLLEAYAEARPGQAGLALLRQSRDLYEQAGLMLAAARVAGKLAVRLAADPALSDSALDEAAEAFRAAAGAGLQATAPLDWARLQVGLADVLQRRSQNGAQAEPLQQAIATLRAVRERLEGLPAGRAEELATLANLHLGAALAEQAAALRDPAGLAEAMAAYGTALSSPKLPAEDRVSTVLAVAALRKQKGLWSHDADQVASALSEYDQALDMVNPQDQPALWTATQSARGDVADVLSQWFGQSNRTEEALEAYQAALLPQTRTEAPLQWASLKYNIARNLHRLGEAGRSPGRLEEAAESYRLALMEYSRLRTPEDWAKTKLALGRVLQTQGELMSSVAVLEQAREAYLDAALVFGSGDRGFQGAQIRLNLAQIELTLFNVTADKKRLEAAWNHALAARTAFDALQAPHQRHAAEKLLKTVQVRLDR